MESKSDIELNNETTRENNETVTKCDRFKNCFTKVTKNLSFGPIVSLTSIILNLVVINYYIPLFKSDMDTIRGRSNEISLQLTSFISAVPTFVKTTEQIQNLSFAGQILNNSISSLSIKIEEVEQSAKIYNNMNNDLKITGNFLNITQNATFNSINEISNKLSSILTNLVELNNSQQILNQLINTQNSLSKKSLEFLGFNSTLFLISYGAYSGSQEKPLFVARAGSANICIGGVCGLNYNGGTFKLLISDMYYIYNFTQLVGVTNLRCGCTKIIINRFESINTLGLFYDGDSFYINELLDECPLDSTIFVVPSGPQSCSGSDGCFLALNECFKIYL